MESLLVEEEGGIRRCRTALADITPRKRAEEETKKLNELLESRILQRTVELKAANKVLQNEVIERKKAEQALAR